MLAADPQPSPWPSTDSGQPSIGSVRPAVPGRSERTAESEHQDRATIRRQRARQESGSSTRPAATTAQRSPSIPGDTQRFDAPVIDAAVAFTRTLADRSATAPRALPQRWQPLATALVGDKPVRISTSSNSQAALRAAGKVAATSGNVIHLDHEPVHHSDAALLAHELTHVASASPRPRFFDDDRPSAEERRAEHVADIIRRSPVLPRADSAAQLFDVAGQRDALAPAVSPGAATAVSSVRRSAASTAIASAPPAVVRRRLNSGSSPPAPSRQPSGRAGSVDADELVSRLTSGSGARSAPSQPAQTIRRSNDPIAPVQRVFGSDESAPVYGDQPETGWGMLDRAASSSGQQDLMDWIMEQIESRMASELERRGGYYRGDF
jgi:Domain of unknown function (DUF4157)